MTDTENLSSVQPELESTPQTNEENPNDIGRFKSAGELLRAYTSLEKEFTKRSQRIKSLEKELSEKAETPKVYMQENWQELVDKFTENNPSVAPFKSAISEEILNGELQNNPDCLELATARVILKNYKAPSTFIEDDGFLEQNVYKNEKIKDHIIKDYLKGINSVRTVKTIGAGGQPAMSTAIRPKSIGEAGKLVMQMAGRGK